MRLLRIPYGMPGVRIGDDLKQSPEARPVAKGSGDDFNARRLSGNDDPPLAHLYIPVVKLPYPQIM
jgi:hypothetical protein